MNAYGFFNDGDQSRQFAMSASESRGNEAPYGRTVLDGPSILDNEVAYQYQSLPPRGGAFQPQEGGHWWTQQGQGMDDVILPQRAMVVRSKKPAFQNGGPMTVYENRELSPADQEIYRHYLEEGRPHDVIDNHGRRGKKTAWSGGWRQVKGPYSSQAQQQVAYVEQPMVQQGYVTRTAEPVLRGVPYETHQVVYGGGHRKRGIFGF